MCRLMISHNRSHVALANGLSRVCTPAPATWVCWRCSKNEKYSRIDNQPFDKADWTRWMEVQKWAAFSAGSTGGNPAGIVLTSQLPSSSEMQRIAGEVGFSETAFAVNEGDSRWRVRYFSPESEVPFCGHATIALGAALAKHAGDGVFELSLSQTEITVEGRKSQNLFAASLQSPATKSKPVTDDALAAALALFGLSTADLDERIAPAEVSAGADHLVLMLKNRSKLAAMSYDFEAGKLLTRDRGWVTVLLGHASDHQRFSVRNAFAYGGVYEDPATGAAAAAFAAYLRDLGWPHGGAIDIEQGDDMGIPCRIHADIPALRGSSIRLSGMARLI